MTGVQRCNYSNSAKHTSAGQNRCKSPRDAAAPARPADKAAETTAMNLHFFSTSCGFEKEDVSAIRIEGEEVLKFLAKSHPSTVDNVMTQKEANRDLGFASGYVVSS